MDDNLYDEFGVYLGPDLDDDDVASDHEMEAGEAGSTSEQAGGFRMDIGTSRFGTSMCLSIERGSVEWI